jgi:hypothetical protein
MKALEEVGRKDSSAYAELAASKPTPQTNEVEGSKDIAINLDNIKDYDSDSFIQEAKRVFNVVFKPLGKGKLGGFYPGTKDIVLSDSMSGEKVVTTLAHEVIHGILDKLSPENKKKLHSELKNLFSEIRGEDLKVEMDNIGKGLYRELNTKPEEFLTHGLTDPKVLALLNTKKYNTSKNDTVSIIDKILKIISDIVIKDNTVAKELKNIFEKYSESQSTQQTTGSVSNEDIKDNFEEAVDNLVDQFSENLEDLKVFTELIESGEVNATNELIKSGTDPAMFILYANKAIEIIQNNHIQNLFPYFSTKRIMQLNYQILSRRN